MSSNSKLRTFTGLTALLFAGFTLSGAGCGKFAPGYRPPTGAANQKTGAISYYEGSQVDSDAKNKSEGGLSLKQSETQKAPLTQDGIDKNNYGDRRTLHHKDWMIFHSRVTLGKSLALEYYYKTDGDDKHTDKMLATTSIAFSPNWPKTDISQARYLIMWLKSSDPNSDIKPELAIQSTNESKGLKTTDYVDLSEYVLGKRIGKDWTKVTVPITAFPDITKVDITEAQSIVLKLGGTPVANKDEYLLVDNVYFTDATKITPVENVGYMQRGDGALVVWDKAPIEQPKRFSIKVGEKEILSVKGGERMAIIPSKLLPAGKSAVISITTVGEEESSNPVNLELDMKRPPENAAVVTIDSTPRHEISPYIFGTNWAEPETITKTGVTINRWGGMRTSKYNWEYDVDSSGADYFFMNGYSKTRGADEDEKGYYGFITKTADAGAAVNFTLPTGPYIAKPHMEDAERYCGFPKGKLPKQNSFDPSGECGDGLEPGKDGKKIWTNDPKWSNVPNTVEHQRKFLGKVKQLINERKAKNKKTELLISLDNEPGLWFESHRDSSPKGINADELVKMNTDYAALVKEVLPGSKVIGWSAWGALELAGSNLDYTPPGETGYQNYGTFKNPAEEQWRDRKAHGYTTQLEYYLKQMAVAEKKAGKRLIDIVDIHWYPESVGVNSNGDTLKLSDNLEYDPALAAQQFDALREWYDPTYTNATWLAQAENKAAFWSPFHPVIPALKKLVAQNYPGTKLAINEYDVGSRDYFHGALLRVAAMGIFMQEDLYMAQAWFQSNDKRSFVFLAQQMYGNYDGKGGRVGGKFYASKSDNGDLMSYVVDDGKHWFAVLVNKNPEARMRTTLAFPAKISKFKSYVLSETLGQRVLEADSQKASGERIALYVPAMSATLVVAE